MIVTGVKHYLTTSLSVKLKSKLWSNSSNCCVKNVLGLRLKLKTLLKKFKYLKRGNLLTYRVELLPGSLKIAFYNNLSCRGVTYTMFLSILLQKIFSCSHHIVFYFSQSCVSTGVFRYGMFKSDKFAHLSAVSPGIPEVGEMMRRRWDADMHA